MGAPFLGGLRIRFVAWMGANAIRVDFESFYRGRFQYQLYAGRTLIGQTYSPAERHIVAPLAPTHWPQVLQVVAVSSSQRLTDYGRQLPPRPYNKALIDVVTTSWPADSRSIEVAAGDEPGGVVDPDHIVARQNWRRDQTYTLTTIPLGPSGGWNFQVAGRDARPPGGNRGLPRELSTTLLTQPSDYALTAAGARFDASVADNTLSVQFTYRDDP